MAYLPGEGRGQSTLFPVCWTMTVGAHGFFDPLAFLTHAGLGRKCIELKRRAFSFLKETPRMQFSMFNRDGYFRTVLRSRSSRRPISLILTPS